MSSYLRTYKEFNLDEVSQSLLILGDLVGDCAKCKHLGIEWVDTKECPECGVTFKYISSRRMDNHPGERFQIVKRIREQRPDLTVIDYVDYQKLMGQKKARDLFG